MPSPLEGRTVVMSGGSRGIGLAIAVACARAGANVALLAKTDQPHPKLEGTVHTADDPERAWRESGRVGAPPAALEAAGDELLLATHEPRVLRSIDGGQRWTPLVDG